MCMYLYSFFFFLRKPGSKVAEPRVTVLRFETLSVMHSKQYLGQERSPSDFLSPCPLAVLFAVGPNDVTDSMFLFARSIRFYIPTWHGAGL